MVDAVETPDGPGHVVGSGVLRCLPPTHADGTITLRYEGTDHAGAHHRFTETIELPGRLEDADADVVGPLLALLSGAASLSYFKALAPGRLEVPDGLTDVERHFLTELSAHGLGEFAYENDLPAVLDTPVVGPTLPPRPTGQDRERPVRRALTAVGGGKDSIVSIEALKRAGYDVGLFSVNSYAPIEATARVAGLPLLSARRRLDPALFALNAAGAPNGHVPVTAVNSIVALLTALALGFDTVAFSNEASASYGNVVWHERTINHQWSKGRDFEQLLRGALPAGAPTYLSLLRPLTELRIARHFAGLTAYHPVFTSCNRAFKLDAAARTSWCGDCPKCRFVFLCLAPFLPGPALLAIFGGRDLFADPAQRTGFLELLGVDGLLKPFECVGEPDECRVALQLLRSHPDWRDHPILGDPAVAAITATEADAAAAFAFRGDEHVLPADLEAVVRAL
ncbi:hypothetical protein [Nocardioides sp.]|uniref:hypothetical protein n=1 Tax=Nocardioides sp. TaxID=35761 RepID=UPI0035172ED4